jgi:hypothetical protein
MFNMWRVCKTIDKETKYKICAIELRRRAEGKTTKQYRVWGRPVNWKDLEGYFLEYDKVFSYQDPPSTRAGNVHDFVRLRSNRIIHDLLMT